MRAYKITAEDWASYYPISILAPHTQLNYVPLTRSGMQLQCLGTLYFQSLSLCLRLHWTNTTFYSALWFLLLFFAQDAFSPSVLLMKSKTLLTNFWIFLSFESSYIQFSNSYLEENTTTSFVKRIWIKFKVSATQIQVVMLQTPLTNQKQSS